MCIRLLCLPVVLLMGACATFPQTQHDRSVILGVTHSGGSYNFGNTTQDFVSQGADDVLALGSRTIKIWFIHPEQVYPFNTVKWPVSFNSLVEMAEHPYYKALFDKPFKTFILVVYSLGREEHYWRNGVTESECANEQRQFYELSKHLLTTYSGTGKTFVLQHWEGDWAIRGCYDPKSDPTPTAVDGMVAWLNARQDGVDEARREVGSHGVHVYHAPEVNLVAIGMNENRPNVANRVLPRTHVDLCSYSSWDTVEKPAEFRRALDYINEHMPLPTPDNDFPNGFKRVYVGEYGWPENDSSPEKALEVVKGATETALDWGCPYVVYWEIYCNEPRRRPVIKNDDVRGVWLIKPDGTKSVTWHYLHERIGKS